MSLFHSLQQCSSNEQASLVRKTESSVTNINQQDTKDEGHPVSTSHKRDHSTESAASQTTCVEGNNKNEEQASNVTSSEEFHPPSGLQEEKTGAPCSFNIQSNFEKKDLLDHIKGVIYGNCIGDAIGLLTEFMSKTEAAHVS